MNEQEEKKIEYLKIGERYSSKDFVIITENEKDGSQSFFIKKRKEK